MEHASKLVEVWSRMSRCIERKSVRFRSLMWLVQCLIKRKVLNWFGWLPCKFNICHRRYVRNNSELQGTSIACLGGECSTNSRRSIDLESRSGEYGCFSWYVGETRSSAHGGCGWDHDNRRFPRCIGESYSRRHQSVYSSDGRAQSWSYELQNHHHSSHECSVLFLGVDRTAGAIRGRSGRVIDVVTAEMEKYEPGEYTEGVMESVRVLRDQSNHSRCWEAELCTSVDFV